MKRSLLKIFGQKDAQQKDFSSGQPQAADIDLPSDLYTFVYLPQNKGWIGKYPVTNLQYQRFLEAPDFADKQFWVDFPKYSGPPDYRRRGTWGEDGWHWLQKSLSTYYYEPGPYGKLVAPVTWRQVNFGIQRPGVPVVGITWYEANAYCKWLQMHWNEYEEAGQNPELKAGFLRLPRECEWEEAAGGIKPNGSYAWDQVTKDVEQIIRRANIRESKIGHTTPVNQYPLGQSPLGVWDLTGNVDEWQANMYEYSAHEQWCVRRGGGWDSDHYGAAYERRLRSNPEFHGFTLGFRVIYSPI